MEDKKNVEEKIRELGRLFDEYLKKLNELKIEQDALINEYASRLSEKKKELLSGK